MADAPERDREAPGRHTLGYLKQQVTRIYNAVNQEFFAQGVDWIRIDVIGNRILIIAKHRRIRGLAKLDATRRELTRIIDVALIDENKKLLKQELEKEFPEVQIRTILKDYDPVTELSGTIVVGDKSFEELFKE
ncbi:MAG: DUF2294 domain-containing protein [Bacillota bacterium]